MSERTYALRAEGDATVDDTTIYLVAEVDGAVYARLPLPWCDAGIRLAQRAAAADDLYRELEDAASKMEALADDCCRMASEEYFRQKAERYRHALAKARGEVSCT